MKYYFMAFVPQGESGYAIFSPDFREVASQGRSLEECMEMAQDALAVATDSYAEQGEACPEPCGLEEAGRRTRELLAKLGFSAPPDIIYQLVHAPVGGTEPVSVGRSRQTSWHGRLNILKWLQPFRTA